MPEEREEPDLDHVREAMREHDERQEDEAPAEEPEAPEENHEEDEDE